LINKKITPLK